MKRNVLTFVKSSLLFLCLTFGHAAAMVISVNLPSNEQATLEVEPSDSVVDVKLKRQDARGIVATDQYLSYTGSLLNDGTSLAD